MHIRRCFGTIEKCVGEIHIFMQRAAYSILTANEGSELANSIGKPFSWAHSTRWKWRRIAIHHRSIQADDVDENEIEMKVYLSRKSIHDYPLAYYSIRRERKNCQRNIGVQCRALLSLYSSPKPNSVDIATWIMTILHHRIGKMKPIFNCKSSLFVRKMA